MARRIQLHIDILDHINDIMFHVYRSENPEVTREGATHVMSVAQPLAIKERYMQQDEVLKRDAFTPYAFHVKRHYQTDEVIPNVTLGVDDVDPNDVFYNSYEKMIEVHSGEIGVFDGRTVYMDYEYIAMPVMDDHNEESGKTYLGPVAHGLHRPLDFSFKQDFINKKIHLSFTQDREPKPYFYRIYAEDSVGNVSEWSEEKIEVLTQPDIFFRIERSANGETWEEVSLSNMEEWMDDIHTSDRPENIKNLSVHPLGSKVSKLAFDNPWFYFKDYPRESYQYRVRAEDVEGEFTDWIYFGPIDVFIEPRVLTIRRKLDNGDLASKDEIDAFTVFTIRKEDVSIEMSRLELIDDQLNDASIYSYTFFYEDEISKEAEPFFAISDHTSWRNIIVFVGETQNDLLTHHDFVSTFTLADRVIEIGTEEG